MNPKNLAILCVVAYVAYVFGKTQAAPAEQGGAAVLGSGVDWLTGFAA